MQVSYPVIYLHYLIDSDDLSYEAISGELEAFIEVYKLPCRHSLVSMVVHHQMNTVSYSLFDQDHMRLVGDAPLGYSLCIQLAVDQESCVFPVHYLWDMFSQHP